MHYYDPNDRNPRRWAIFAAAAYGLLLAGAFAFVSFDFRRIVEKPDSTIEIELMELPAKPPQPPVKAPAEPRIHQTAAPVEQTAQVAGNDEVTRTPNPKALFQMNKGGVDKPDNAGNPRAPKGEDKAKGTGTGLDVDGMDQLDRGLQGRGLIGSLPRPDYPGKKSGKIVIRVTVGPNGNVTSASFEPKGSTESDSQLVAAALTAARKARFTESAAAVQGGTITYIFRMQ